MEESLHICTSSISLGSAALHREALRESLDICTIIVDHVVPLHPFHPFLTCIVQLLWKPIAVTSTSWTARRWSRRPYASFSVKIPVRGSERSCTPICLHKSASCGSIIGVPEARVYPHGLALQEGNTIGFLILELSNGGAINWKTETRNRKQLVDE